MSDTYAAAEGDPATTATDGVGEARPTPIAWILLLPVRFYRKVISPFLPPICRFYPSCSAYAAEALTRHGAARGSYLAARRLLRCGPWTPPGRDPVPEEFSFRYQRPESPIEE